MGQIADIRSSTKMAKSASAVKKSSSKGKGASGGALNECYRLSDPKVQVGLAALVLIIAVLAYMVHKSRARRRRYSCC